MLKNKAHLTPEGLNQVIKIKSGMNKGSLNLYQGFIDAGWLYTGGDLFILESLYTWKNESIKFHYMLETYKDLDTRVLNYIQ